MVRIALVGTTLLGLTACLTPPTEGEQDGLRTLSQTLTTNTDGLATFTFEVTDEDAMLLTLQPESPYQSYVDKLYDPGGAVVFDAEILWEDDRYLSSGAFPDGVVSLNWPVDDAQALSPGTWTMDVGVLDDELFYVRGADVTLDGQLKRDAAMDEGDLKIDIVYVGDVIGDDEVDRAMTEAVAYWEQLYAQIGLTIDVEWFEYDAVADLPSPGFGAKADYTAIADSTRFRAVNVVVVQDIRDGAGLYGMAGGIPGPLVSSGNSAVTISAATNAGGDFAFDAEEVRLLGETLAHEVGHFAGLFHPVESSFTAWDAVSDTPECADEGACIDALGENLMFPYPVCFTDTGCVPQDWISGGQGAIEHRYTGVW